MACWEVSSLSIAGSLANNKFLGKFPFGKKKSTEKKNEPVPSVGNGEFAGFSQVRLTTIKVELASTDDHRVLSLGQTDSPLPHFEKNSFLVRSIWCFFVWCCEIWRFWIF